MTIYYATGIDGPGSGNNYASTVRCHFYKTEEEAKEYAENAEKKYGHETDTGSFNGSKGWIFAWGTEYNDIRIKPMGESAARKICSEGWSNVDSALDVSNAEDDESRLFYFKKFTPGCWLTTSVDSPSGEGFKWQYDAYSQKIEESVKTETKMKHVKLFEAFVASQKLNENIDSHGKLEISAEKLAGTKLISFYFEEMRTDMVLCAARDEDSIYDTLLGGFTGEISEEGRKYDATTLADPAYDNDGDTSSAIYKKKWAEVCKYLGVKNTDEIVHIHVLISGGTNAMSDDFSDEEIEYAELAYEKAKVVKKFKVEEYDGTEFVK